MKNVLRSVYGRRASATRLSTTRRARRALRRMWTDFGAIFRNLSLEFFSSLLGAGTPQMVTSV